MADCTPVVCDLEDTPQLDFIASDRLAGAGPHACVVYITTFCLGWVVKLCLLQIFCTSGPSCYKNRDCQIILTDTAWKNASIH